MYSATELEAFEEAHPQIVSNMPQHAATVMHSAFATR
jgi:hypothetical protein